MMVDFEFDALLQVCLHREPPEVGGVKKLTKSLLVGRAMCLLVGRAVCANPT